MPVPFDPDNAWGAKRVHHVTGSLDGCELRGVVDRDDDGHVLAVGPSWNRGGGQADGATVDVVLEPEGPQRGDLAADVAAALDASPEAAAFFDYLAQAYRTAYLRWIDATKRPARTAPDTDRRDDPPPGGRQEATAPRRRWAPPVTGGGCDGRATSCGLASGSGAAERSQRRSHVVGVGYVRTETDGR